MISVVRIGPIENNPSAEILRNALVSHFRGIHRNDDEPPPHPRHGKAAAAAAAADGDDCKTINNDIHHDEEVEGATTRDNNHDNSIVVRNKYFSAHLVLDDIAEGSGRGGSSGAENGTPVGPKETRPDYSCCKDDGVILAFDAVHSNPDRSSHVAAAAAAAADGGGGVAATSTTTTATAAVTFDALHAVHERVEAGDGASFGDLLRLCVAVSIGSVTPREVRGTDHEREYSRRILWCLDRGYEYVEADLSTEGQLRGTDVRDKDGFARIVEAIEGTMWSSAVMAKTKTKELKARYENDRSSILQSTSDREKEATVDSDGPARTGDVNQEENLYQPPDPSMLIDGMVQDDTDAAASDAAVADAFHVSGDGVEVDDDIVRLRGDLEAETAFDEMEMMLKEASRIREASKNGTMSDEERRERAGEAALKLVNLMSHLGLDEGDDETSDDGSASDGSEVANTVDDSCE
jgi:Alpha and gamma adaptin binding protein p34